MILKILMIYFSKIGKYSANNIPDDYIGFNQSTIKNDTANETNKKLDEITPLLHQASISSAKTCDTEVNAAPSNLNNGANTSRNHKSSYRKRVKTKLSRKSA